MERKLASRLYEHIEDSLQKKIRSIGQKSINFLADNYLFICLFCAFLWLFYALYPGTVAYDSFHMYVAAYYHSRGNWHSALLTRFWQCLLSITEIKGIFMLIPLMSTCLGLYIISKNISRGIITGIICLFILFIPPVFTYITVVLKDTYLASLIFLVAALMLDNAISEKKKTISFYLFSALVLIFCFYVRSNGCFIAVPLLVAIFLGWKAPIFYRYITCLALVLCVVTTTSFIDLNLLKAKEQAPDFSLMLFDIAGTAKYSGTSTLPDVPGVPDQVGLFKNCYSSTQWDTVSTWAKKANCKDISTYFFNELDAGPMSLKKARHDIREAWIAAIMQHTKAYLKHRIKHFNQLIDYIGHRPVFQPVYVKAVGFINMVGSDQDRSFTYTANPPQLWNTVINMDLGNQLWFHPYVSLLILLFFYLSTLATNDQFNRTLNVVSFSGLIYLVGFLFVGVSADFRYSYPSLLLSILCILAAFAFYSQKREIFGTRKTRIIATLVTVPLFLIGIIL